MQLHKRKNGDAQQIYHYTIHSQWCEMGWGVIKDASLK
ncbi:hypothetical protein predicted by Glimmer/Critica [Bartonella tribocorum CIP 105476]|uniref:Uncharacterized protein n=1 Tax=Bartonella tribocorum (strain DSM 28219 / CCUG 45778 / CIP 105476 / IBS 506) TaxID=382640 RepID=A9IZR0_BART1|nr:hypothetical protein predicted by Glimmer/Critica [Bartonella tribocorum CIP 105476]